MVVSIQSTFMFMLWVLCKSSNPWACQEIFLVEQTKLKRTANCWIMEMRYFGRIMKQLGGNITNQYYSSHNLGDEYCTGWTSVDQIVNIFIFLIMVSVVIIVIINSHLLRYGEESFWKDLIVLGGSITSKYYTSQH